MSDFLGGLLDEQHQAAPPAAPELPEAPVPGAPVLSEELSAGPEAPEATPEPGPAPQADFLGGILADAPPEPAEEFPTYDDPEAEAEEKREVTEEEAEAAAERLERLDHAINNYRHRNTYEEDPNFNIDRDYLEDMKRVVPEMYHEDLETRLREHAVSRDHAHYLTSEYMQTKKDEETLRDYGFFGGTWERMQAAFTDPGQWAAGMAIGGIFGPVLGSLIGTGRAASVLGGAVLGAAENAAIEWGLTQGSIARDQTDIAYAAAFGGLLGGGFGGIFHRAPKGSVAEGVAKEMQDAAPRQMDAIERAIIEEATTETGEPDFDKLFPMAGDEWRKELELHDALIDQDLIDEDIASGRLRINRKGELVESKPEARMGETYARDYLDSAEIEVPDDVKEHVTGYAKSRYGKARYDMGGRIGMSENPMYRALGDMLFEDPTVKRDFQHTGVAATEIAEQTLRRAETPFMQAANRNFGAWLKEQGIINPAQYMFSMHHKNAYYEAITEAVETGRGSPAVMEAAREFGNGTGIVYDEAAQGGLKGFAEGTFPKKADYVPRVPSPSKVAQSTQWKLAPEIMTDPTRPKGFDSLQELVRRSFIAANPDVDLEYAAKFARLYVTRIRGQAAGRPMHLLDVSNDSVNYMADLLEDIGMDADGIEFFIKGIRGKRGQTEVKQAKRRAMMDIYHEMKLADGTSVRLADVMERNSLKLLSGYARSVGGMAAIGKRTKGTPLHIKSNADWERMLRYAEKMSNEMGLDGRKEAKYLDVGWKRLTGKPLYNTDSVDGSMAGFRRFINNWNIARLLGQVVYSQAAETGQMMAVGGLREVAQQFPVLSSLRRRIASGSMKKLDDDLLSFVEVELGLGTEYSRYDDGFMWDSDLAGTISSRGFKEQAREFGHKLRKPVLGPMLAVQDMQQKHVAVRLMQRLTNHALGRKALEGTQVERLGAIGLHGEKLERVLEQLKKHAEVRDGNFVKAKLSNPRLDKWDDLEARDSFRHAIFREARRVVQEVDIGNTWYLQNSNFWSLMLSLRGFTMAAYSKATLNGIAYFDFQALKTMIFAGTAAYAARMLQVHVSSLGMDEEKRQEYLEKHLDQEELITAAVQRMPMASIFPGLYDTFAPAFGADRRFDYRSSGLGAGIGGGGDNPYDPDNPLGAAPWLDLGGKAVGALTGAGRSVFDETRQYSQADLYNFRYLLPYANLYGIGNVWNLISAQLPKSTKEGRP